MSRKVLPSPAWLLPPLLLLCGLLWPGRGQAAGQRFLVLVIAGFDEHQGIAENAAEILIARLAQRGLESVGPEGLSKDYADLSSLRRCAVDLGCICRAATTIGVERVLLGLMSRQDEQVTTSVEVIDVETRRSLARTSARVTEDELAPRLLELAGRLLDQLAEPGQDKATLLLKIEGGTAERILVDGAAVGAGTRWTLEKVEPGEHELLLELADGSRVVRRLSLEPGSRELVVRVGTAALPHERHYQRAEEALLRGDAQRAYQEARAALEEPGGDLGEVHLLLARACLGLLRGGKAGAEHVEVAFGAARRATDLQAGAQAVRLRSELARSFAQVRLEPGEGWGQPGAIVLETLRSSQPQLSEALARELGRQPWELPRDVYLPRPGHYRLNGRDLLVEGKAEGRLLILTLPPVARRDRQRAWLDLSLLGALGPSGFSTPIAGLAATLLPWCHGSGCLTTRLEASVQLGTIADAELEQRYWLRAGPGWAWPLLEQRLRLDLSADALLAPKSGKLGLGLGGAASWLLLPHLRLGLRPSWNLYALKVKGSMVGFQLEAALEL